MIGSNTAVRRYSRRVLGLSLLYAVLLVGAISVFKHRPPVGPIAYLLAVLPALPIIGMFAAIGRYLVEERDEYLRDQMVRQSLVATGFAMSVATAWGFLESFDMVHHVEAYYIAVVWFAGLGIGACVNGFVARAGDA